LAAQSRAAASATLRRSMISNCWPCSGALSALASASSWLARRLARTVALCMRVSSVLTSPDSSRRSRSSRCICNPASGVRNRRAGDQDRGHQFGGENLAHEAIAFVQCFPDLHDEATGRAQRRDTHLFAPVSAVEEDELFRRERRWRGEVGNAVDDRVGG